MKIPVLTLPKLLDPGDVTVLRYPTQLNAMKCGVTLEDPCTLSGSSEIIDEFLTWVEGSADWQSPDSRTGAPDAERPVPG